jgi:hypothetical protein
MSDDPESLSTTSAAHPRGPVTVQDAIRELSNGPIGAYIVAGVAVGLLLLGWLVFYFFLFLPRGPIG